jgi:hypothetical protein
MLKILHLAIEKLQQITNYFIVYKYLSTFLTLLTMQKCKLMHRLLAKQCLIINTLKKI